MYRGIPNAHIKKEYTVAPAAPFCTPPDFKSKLVKMGEFLFPDGKRQLSISGHHECPEMDNLFYAVIDYQ